VNRFRFDRLCQNIVRINLKTIANKTLPPFSDRVSKTFLRYRASKSHFYFIDLSKVYSPISISRDFFTFVAPKILKTNICKRYNVITCRRRKNCMLEISFVISMVYTRGFIYIYVYSYLYFRV